MATLFTEGFIADLTADANKRLTWIAIPSTRQLEQEIANEDRKLERLAQLDDTHLVSRSASVGERLSSRPTACDAADGTNRRRCNHSSSGKRVRKCR